MSFWDFFIRYTECAGVWWGVLIALRLLKPVFTHPK